MCAFQYIFSPYRANHHKHRTIYLCNYCKSLLYTFSVFFDGPWQILEPVMKVEVAAPVEYQGAVMGTLQRRHGIVRAQDSTQDFFTVLCEVCTHRSCRLVHVGRYSARHRSSKISARYYCNIVSMVSLTLSGRMGAEPF